MVGKRILILDESEASRKFLANFLHEKQFEIFGAPSGKEALIMAWRDLPDLILFDPALSDISDGEFIQKLRNNARTSNTPIDRKSTRLNSSHIQKSRMPSSA